MKWFGIWNSCDLKFMPKASLRELSFEIWALGITTSVSRLFCTVQSSHQAIYSTGFHQYGLYAENTCIIVTVRFRRQQLTAVHRSAAFCATTTLSGLPVRVFSAVLALPPCQPGFPWTIFQTHGSIHRSTK